ncbi:uncharacterized protein J3D65DRAFT_620184 [Phyllosticta citribraziliensis]|uniref:Uncharacterized protein n=1 Tax=Phyllosticta citribraziliensis TaxID=989973 RepID=A0ABR1LXJ0_9PEZI
MATAFKYIISKRLDPLFAACIGIAAAASRISREERAQGRSGGASETWSVLRRRWGVAFGH